VWGSFSLSKFGTKNKILKMDEVTNEGQVDEGIVVDTSCDVPVVTAAPSIEEEEDQNDPSESNNAPVAVECEAPLTEEQQQTPEEIINNLLIENETLKQENHELRLRIEQLENLHLSNPEPSPTRTATSGSLKTETSKSAGPPATTDSNAKKVCDLSSFLNFIFVA
jgi:hypothetical protein